MTKRIVLIGILILSGIWQHIFAQHIEFKDPRFKKCLLDPELGIDTNHNLEIEFEEALSVKVIELNKKDLTDISEIRFFKNLERLSCYENKIDSLIIEDLPKLKELNCRTNHITYLKIEQLISLEKLIAGMNQLTFVEINDCPNLQSLYLQYNQLTNIDLTKFPLLKYVEISHNELHQIDISRNSNLIQITVDYNKLKELDIRKNTAIKYIYVDDDVERIMTKEQKKISPFLIKPPAEMTPPPSGK